MEFDGSNWAGVDGMKGFVFLKRFVMFVPNSLDMVHVIYHIADVHDQISWVESYQLRFKHFCTIVGQYSFMIRKERLGVKIRQYLGQRNENVSIWLNHIRSDHQKLKSSCPSVKTLRRFIAFLKRYQIPVNIV
jgi:hypothetical protein